MMTLERTGTAHDDLEALQEHAAVLEARLRERAREAERSRTELEAFRLRYRDAVGRLHERLDELELAIAEAELGELSRKIDEAEAEDGEAPQADPVPEQARPARFTSDAVRRLFRDVAKAIHPDLADDERARDRRHALMIEANRAYARGDEEHLRWILDAWARSPDAVRGSDPDATRIRLERRIAECEEHLARVEQDLATLKESPLWELKALVDREAVRGRDLVADMVKRLERDIMVATNRLDAMRS